MVYRIYVEKKDGFANEAKSLLADIVNLLQIEGLTGLRIINRYDVEGLDEDLFKESIKTVFSEPQVDRVYEELELDQGERAFAVEFLPGQFDQRAASAAECIELISKRERPEVKSAKVYVLEGDLTDEDLAKIKSFIINPVESREASMEPYETLKTVYETPDSVQTIKGFRKMSAQELEKLAQDMGLAMDIGDLAFCRNYFVLEHRDPTVTEIRVIDTYWSDHCRHTTFNTVIDRVEFEDAEVAKAFEDYMKVRQELGRTKPVTLMDIGTISAKYLKSKGLLDKLDESEEINACTVKIKADMNGQEKDWLLFFKNETHNHPTEIEPFGGAATCVGGAIRDPLSGRSYVYTAMRVTGAADPLKAVSETLEGKLPQRKIVTTAADGYSSYGNQIGLATGQVEEIYHPGYEAKRMEIGAVVGAAPAENVIRKVPEAGDKVILLGGKTGRDGCGGATGSSKSHTTQSLESCGAEVQKGNAPEERKLQRLFRNPEASKLIKRCNDFGAGGVSVAVGELADGLSIDLNKVPKKYAGLDGTELAISESQERMAVVVAADDVEKFCFLAERENLESTVIATVTEHPVLKLYWNGKEIVNIKRTFLDTNGMEKHTTAYVPLHLDFDRKVKGDFRENYFNLASDLNVCSKRGLSERFDSTIGAGTVLMPFGGKYQRTPIQAMVNLISSDIKYTDTCSVMAYGYNPYITSASPFHGAYLAVVESVSKLVATGASFEDVYLSFQEYFEKLGDSPEKWGKPVAALLGAFEAQIGLGVAAIGGKDSMSGSFENLHVPPTLVSFAITTDKAYNIISSEFKEAGNKVILLKPEVDEIGLPSADSLKRLFAKVTELMREGHVKSCWTPVYGGIAEGILKMAIGNGYGFAFDDLLNIEDIFGYDYGSFILEVDESLDLGNLEYTLLGRVNDTAMISWRSEELPLSSLLKAYEDKLESIFRCNIHPAENSSEAFSYEVGNHRKSSVKVDRPKVLIPVFPGTNCEYDSAKAFENAGALVETFVINNLTPESVAKSVRDFAAKVRESQIIFIPGGFSGGDEPDGSGKFITAFFRNQEIKEAVNELLEERDGLMAGICNGFQALIKLGLVPYGKIMDSVEEDFPTLTFNEIGRHQSKIVQVRVASNKSPWMARTKVGEIYSVPISHGEGRFIAGENLIRELAKNGQILTQYVDLEGRVSTEVQFNPNGSFFAIEGLTSYDGRVLGKMGHAERIGGNLYKNVPGDYEMEMFKSAVEYFK